MAQLTSKLQESDVCCSDNITSCPSARILKVLLNRIGKTLQTPNDPSNNIPKTEHIQNVQIKINQILDRLVSEYPVQYSATKLLDDLHHLKTEHGIHDDDAQFDTAFEFFKECTSEKGCDINQCPLIRRHYRDRNVSFVSGGAVNSDNQTDEVLLDTVAMIHCYLLHSFDINRLTKEERDSIETQLSYGISLEDNQKGHETLVDDMRRVELTAEILQSKQKKLKFARRIGRYRDDAHDSEYVKLPSDKSVDFTAMADALQMDEAVLREGLTEYGNDRDRLIGDSIDVVYGENVEGIGIWKVLNIDDEEKNNIFRLMLHGHFKCTQLSTMNMIKICQIAVQRMEFQIDFNELQKVLTSNGVDGQIYDKCNPATHQSVNQFAQKFKSTQNCYSPHVRRMYNVIRKWKYIKMKKKSVKKQEDAVDDGKEDEKDPVDDDENDENVSEQQPTVYEIGKQFYFWKLLKGHHRFVKAKYVDMKEEVMHSPLLDGMVSVSAWNKLTKDIAVMIATEYAMGTTSNGLSFRLYGIPKFEPLDAEHLRALKLYTDFNKLCSEFCAILRDGDPMQISEIANWTRILVEMVQCYGTPLNASKVYYRGVNKSFLFKTIATKFNLPWSTTTSVW